jgi:hypothetical protein
MTIFLDILKANSKGDALLSAAKVVRNGKGSACVFDVDPSTFADIPTSAFAYWTTEKLRAAFRSLPAFQSGRRHACKTNPAGDDTRYLRLWWEPSPGIAGRLEWKPLAKGGNFSPYYYDIHLVVAWNPSRKTYLGYLGTSHRPLERPASLDYFFRPGITWPSRTQRFGPRLMPAGTIFTGKGPASFDELDCSEHILAICALMNSKPFNAFVETRLNAADATARSYEVGMIQLTPVPDIDASTRQLLASLALRQWQMRRELDSVFEISHAFILPAAILFKDRKNFRAQYDLELENIQQKIDEIAYLAYGISPEDCTESRSVQPSPETSSNIADDEDDEDDAEISATSELDIGSILSWGVGVAFGRFDLSIATGERQVPPEPAPFDPLPERSPGMLPDGAAPFHVHAGILVDDQGHPHDLVRLVEEVLAHVDVLAPDGVRRWLQRDFFAFHVQRYSKSRRKAPIYWPLATASGAYTLWLYYPSLTSQTLYSAVNDFIEPKLVQVAQEIGPLRSKGIRSRDEDKTLEGLQVLELELIDLRDSLLEIAASWQPNPNDGVQITAAPLWSLFRHKTWQKVLKDTWTKLEKGDYDWSHLAMSYWPERVREKCRFDKSLAITHGVEHLYEPPPEGAAGGKGRKRKGAAS